MGYIEKFILIFDENLDNFEFIFDFIEKKNVLLSKISIINYGDIRNTAEMEKYKDVKKIPCLIKQTITKENNMITSQTIYYDDDVITNLPRKKKVASSGFKVNAEKFFDVDKNGKPKIAQMNASANRKKLSAIGIKRELDKMYKKHGFKN